MSKLRLTCILVIVLSLAAFSQAQPPPNGGPPNTSRSSGQATVVQTIPHVGFPPPSWTRTTNYNEMGQATDYAAFIGAMENSSRPVAAQIVEKLLPLSFRNLLDIGAASGTWTIAFLKAHPKASATLFDLPDVIPMAKKRIAQARLSDRVKFVPGDFYSDDLPPGADFAWLSAITHQNSRSQNRGLFAKICRALQPQGTLVIRDIVMEKSRTQPPAGALFAVNMLVATQGGGTYTFEEYRSDLLDAGFKNITLIARDDFMNSIIHAEKT